MKLSLDKAVVVEGKYDKIRLSNIIDAFIITTDGFAVFKDKKKQALIKKAADEKGIIVLTDSDSAGFMLRSFISKIAGKENVTHVYIPDLFGKERRKSEPGREGKIGVEGVDDSIILEAFRKSGVSENKRTERENSISRSDLYELGYIGKNDSSSKRKMLLSLLGFPERMNTSSLIESLNMIMSIDELRSIEL